jgi:HTH-type transcriptional regulator, bacterioopsin transcriptional activator and related proteins
MDLRSSATVGSVYLMVGFGAGILQFVPPPASAWAIVGSILIGLTVGTRQDGPDDPLSILTSKIRRVESGEYDVDFTIDRDDEIGQLYEAVSDLIEWQRKRQRERTKELLEQSQRIAEVGGWTTDEREETETHETMWTEKMFDIFELSPDEPPLAEEVMEFYHPDDRAERLADVMRAKEEGVGWDAEARLITAKGNLRWVRTAGEPVFEGGEVTHLYGTVQDITERKEQKRQIEAIVENTINPIYIKYLDGSYQFVNQAAAAVFGLDADEMVDKRDDELFDPDSAAALRADDERIQTTGERVTEERDVTVDGEEHVFLDDKYPYRDSDGSIIGVMGISRDITELKRYERDLEWTADLLQQTERLANVGGWILKLRAPSPSKRAFTDQLYRIHGVSPDEPFTVEKGLSFIHPDDRDIVRSAVEKALETGEGYDLEVRFIPATGEEKWVRTRGEAVYENGEIVKLHGALQDVTDQVAQQAELKRTKDTLEQSQRIAHVGAWELDVRSDEPPTCAMTDEVYCILELPADADVDLERAFEFYHPDDRQRIRKLVERALEDGEGYDAELRLITADGNERWVRAIGEPVLEDGRVVKVRGAIQDITERKERELALESLHDTAHGLLKIETHSEAAALVVDAAASILDVAAVGVYLYEETENKLRPAALSSAFEEYLRGDVSPVGPCEDGFLWHSFVTDNLTVIDDGAAMAFESPFDDRVDHGLVMPIGAHGVFVAVNDREHIDADTQRLVETLVATTETAFDRLEGETHLRERDAELEARNERLRRQIRINETIRSVDRSLVGATSQADLEAEVCERLADGDEIAFAWIAGFEAGGTTLAPRVWAGERRGYLDDVTLDMESSVREPAVEAAASGSPVVVPTVARNVKREPWRRNALASNYQSVLAVPLAFDEYSYGVLAVYATEPDTFGDLERKVFAELGESIANANSSVATKRALHADTLVSLTLRIEGDTDLLTDIARAADCEVFFEGLAMHGADESQLFVRTVGANPAAVADVLADRFAVRSYRLVSESDEGTVFEVTTHGTSIVSKLVRHGGRPVSVTTDAAGMDVVVDLPVSTDVRAFVEMLEEEYDVELVSRREVGRSIQARQGLVEAILDQLTTRQQEVLRAAYLAGFFNSPRDTTGEELATMLDVSQPTINRHLRLAEQRIMRELFESNAERA